MMSWGGFLPSSSKLLAPSIPCSTAPLSVSFLHRTPAQLCLSLQVNTIPAAFHDGLLLYAQAVTETLAHGGTVTDGESITQRMWNRSFQGQGLGVAGMGYLGVPRGRRQKPLALQRR